jgi:hypothetical protein
MMYLIVIALMLAGSWTITLCGAVSALQGAPAAWEATGRTKSMWEASMAVGLVMLPLLPISVAIAIVYFQRVRPDVLAAETRVFDDGRESELVSVS